MRKLTDRCRNCGCTRANARYNGYECAVGYWGPDGEFTTTAEWPRHRWLPDGQVLVRRSPRSPQLRG